VRPGDGVLVTAGAGGVGSFAIQFAKHLGGRVVTTASEKNFEYVKSLGADHVVDYTAGNTVEAVRAAGVPVNVVFDCAGGQALTDAFEVVEPHGRVVSIVDTPKQAPADKRVSAHYMFVSPNGDQLAKIGALIDAGAIRLPEVKIQSIREAARAQDENQSRHVRGKVALRIDF
jgi:NADPH2:quinone reductase